MPAARRAPTTEGDPRLAGLPVSDFNDARMLLRAPFTPQAIRWKVQDHAPNWALIVSYIDARLVIERLNLIVGANWHADYEPTSGGLMWCHLTVCGVTRRDVGQGTGKSLVSDSLKRAAVHFGVGASLYSLPRVDLRPGDYLTQRNTNGRLRSTITPAGTEKLTRDYQAWLSGGQSFGEPFDHGDVEGAQGDIDVPELDAGAGVPVGEFEARADAAAATVTPPDPDDLLALREQAFAALTEIGDTMIEQRINGAKDNPNALRDLLRFASARAERMRREGSL